MSLIRTYVFKKPHRSGNITWVVRWKDPLTGRWISSAAGKTRDEALLVESEIRKKLYLGKDPRERSQQIAEPRLDQLLETYYQSPRFQNLSEGWKESVQNQFNVILPIFGKKYFSQIKREQLFRFFLDLKAKGLTHSTIGKYQLKFKILEDLLKEMIPSHRACVPSSKEFRKLFPKQPPSREINFLTPTELNKIYQELENCRSRIIPLFIRFLASTGMRRSEAIDLKWEDVDFESGFIMIRRSKNGSMRKVPLDENTIDVLDRIPHATQQGYVFKNRDGEQFHKDSFIKPLKTAARRAGILKRIDIHSLRHSWASNKIRQGWGLKKVSMILGHSDITMTSEVYAHLLDGDLKVNDDFRFDKETASENSISVEEPKKSVTAIVQDLIHALKDAQVETLQHSDLAQEIQRMIQKELDSSVEKFLASTESQKNDGFIPHMLRTEEFASKEPKLSSTSSLRPLENTNKKADLASASSAIHGVPDWVRTNDLQLRRLTL